MWRSEVDELQGGRARQFRLFRADERLRYADVAGLWRRDESFRSFFTALLSDAPFPAYRWETPPVIATMAERPFEFVLLDTPALARAPDPAAFADHFEPGDAGPSVVAFDNLGRDAVLVVPCPRGPSSAYGHLAAFVRGAPAAQQHALWQTVGQVLEERLGRQPVWLSTAGMGVAWLHVRLDIRPKYYGFRPYTSTSSGA